MGNWCENCTGGPLVAAGWAGPPPSTWEGALDCMVVRVVVSECSEPFDDEKVLPPPIMWLLPVSALERDERTVSGTVATVGAVDLLLFANARCCSETPSSADVKLSLDRGVSGVEKERWPSAFVLTVPDSG